MMARMIRAHISHPVRYLVPVIAALMLLPFTRPLDMVAIIPLVFLGATMLGATVAPGSTLFDAALPIRGREIVMARAVAALGVVLLPLVAWIAMLLASGGSTTVAQLLAEVALLFAFVATVPHAIARGVRIHSAPASYVPRMAIAAATTAMLALCSPLVVTATFATGIAIALLGVWLFVPDALQLSTSRTRRSPMSRTDAVTVMDAGWRWPIIQASVHPILLILCLNLLWMAAFLGSGVVSVAILTMIVPDVGESRMRWMAALPLSHRARLIAAITPSVLFPALSIVIGWSIYAVRSADPSQVAAAIVGIGTWLSVALLRLSLVQAGRVRWWRPGWVAPVMSDVLAGGAVFAFITWNVLDRVDGAEVVIPRMIDGIRHVAAILPQNPLVVIAVVAVPVLASYLLLEWLFRQSSPGAVVRGYSG